MCGLVGIAGDLAFRDEATMKRLFLLDYFRGPDSTGFAAVRNTGETKLVKVPSHPLDLFDMGRFKEALNGNLSKVFIGHNRAATRGVINHFNAHPFEFDHIIGAHNGTLEKSSHTALERALGETFPVDSQAIIMAIAKLGIDETMKLMEGAWSLVYYNKEDDTLNFLRNKERPMWYAFDSDFKRLFWASEWEFIEGAVACGVGYKFYIEDGTDFRFWKTEENVHYSFDMAVLKAGGTERPKARARVLKGKEPKPVATSGNGHDPFQRRDITSGATTIRRPDGTTVTFGPPGTNTSTPSTAKSRTSTKTSRNDSTRKIVHILGDQRHPFGGLVTEAQFVDLTRHGCSFCRNPVSSGDVGLTFFERDELLLCGTCSKGRGQNRIYTKNDMYLG